jgi:hypothetical protein
LAKKKQLTTAHEAIMNSAKKALSVESRPTADELTDMRVYVSEFRVRVHQHSFSFFIADPVHGAVRGRSLSVLSAMNTSSKL